MDDIDYESSSEAEEEEFFQDYQTDHDFAFELQIQEALIASISLHQPSSSSSSSHSIPNNQTLNLNKSHQQSNNLEKIIVNIRRDRQLAKEIVYISDEDDNDDWEVEEEEEEFGYAIGEGSSSSSSTVQIPAPVVVIEELLYRLYFKGLFNVPSSGIGVAICDHKDNLVKKIHKKVSGREVGNHREVELIGLIQGLEAAVELGIKRIVLYCVNRTIFQQITGRWQVKQKRIATLINQVFRLQKMFETCRPILVPGNNLKYVFQLARDAIDSQISKVVVESSGSTKNKNLKEPCTICLEDTDSKEMFVINGCSHRYCFSCMKQHMEVKILQGVVPGCPHQGCKTTLTVDGTKLFLPPKLGERMTLLIKEASVPVMEKVYCPYPKCSTLMSKKEAQEYTNKFMAADRTVIRKCINCHGLFCIDCKVPWHNTMNCNEFKRSNISARVEEAKLKTLANQNMWRQCVRCNHMIELAEGCYHMTCRCGYEFCYTCGAEWKNKKQTCKCKLWDERNILHDYGDDEDDDDDYHDYDEEDNSDDYYDDFDHEEEDFGRGWHHGIF